MTREASVGDLHVLDFGASGDMNSPALAWAVPDATGTAPLPRQDVSAAVLSTALVPLTAPGSKLTPDAAGSTSSMILFGGCSYMSKVCFNDAYVLSVSGAAWSWAAGDAHGRIPEPREAGSAVLMPQHALGAGTSATVNPALNLRVLLFGGGLLDQVCYDDLYLLELSAVSGKPLQQRLGSNATTVPNLCVRACNEHGTCKDGLCVCNDGFEGDSCTPVAKTPSPAPAPAPAPSPAVPAACPGNCTGHGECVNGTCACADGFFGADCNGCAVADCSLHGKCTDGACVCDAAYTGAGCETELPKPCLNNCTSNGTSSDHGSCDAASGKAPTCVCKPEWTGADCSMSVDLLPETDRVTTQVTFTSPQGYLIVPHRDPRVAYVRAVVPTKDGTTTEEIVAVPADPTLKFTGEAHGEVRPIRILGDATLVRYEATKLVAKAEQGAASLLVALDSARISVGDVVVLDEGMWNEEVAHVSGITYGLSVAEAAAKVAAGGTAPPALPNATVFLELSESNTTASAGDGAVRDTTPTPVDWEGVSRSVIGEPLPADTPTVPASVPAGAMQVRVTKAFKFTHDAQATVSSWVLSSPPAPLEERRWMSLDERLGPCKCKRDGGSCVQTGPASRACVCFEGWTGDLCDVEICPNNCTDPEFGTCDPSRAAGEGCVCEQGMSGPDCSTFGGCGGSGHDCGAHGDCIGGSCACHPGYGGPLCDVVVCPNNCTKQPEFGVCESVGAGRRSRHCVCALGHAGDDCSIPDPCPRNCHGNGVCVPADPAAVGRHCECLPGFGGPLGYCEERVKMKCPSPGDCGGEKNGYCDTNTGVCVCQLGWEGPGCLSKAECRYNCSDHGVCDNNVCRCDPGFSGDHCQISSKCPNACSGHGRACVLGECVCQDGWTGLDCGTPMKCSPADCNGKGMCVLGRCECKDGWAGADCSADTTFQCPKGCSGHGLCKSGKCFCEPGFNGTDCSEELKCPVRFDKECGGHGVCKYGQCFCAPGYDLPDCKPVKPCPIDWESGKVCSGMGVCVNGACFCAPGRFGHLCERGSECAKSNCSGNGFCHDGKCLCDLGYGGADCSKPLPCEGVTPAAPMGCSGRGHCLRGRCFCEDGAAGADCSAKVTCPVNCSAHGHCDGPICICNAGFSGPDCSEPVECPNQCSGQGTCMLGYCSCYPGYAGASCDLHVPCPNECSHHGDCIAGRCICDFDYSGADCSRMGSVRATLATGPECLNKCSGHGHCQSGACVCAVGFTGADCSAEVLCPSNCTGHGLCWHGDCFCDPGYNGTHCGVYVGCPGEGGVDCSGHGDCSHGKCFCYPGFKGSLCEEQPMAKLQDASFAQAKCDKDAAGNECSGHGVCELGACMCAGGWYGRDCSAISTAGECPNGCSQRGICNAQGMCQCEAGFVGLDCSKQSVQAIQAQAAQCLQKCGGPGSHGVCNLGVCVCEPGYTGDVCDIESCPNRCTVDAFGVSNGVCESGRCVCEEGFGGDDCAVVCPNRCSRHGTCAKSAGSNDDASWRCYCQPGFTGADCSVAAVARTGMVVSSLVGIAIATFIVGLCCIPLAKDYWERREMKKYMEILRGGEGSGVPQRLASVPVASFAPVGRTTLSQTQP